MGGLFKIMEIGLLTPDEIIKAENLTKDKEKKFIYSIELLEEAIREKFKEKLDKESESIKRKLLNCKKN